MPSIALSHNGQIILGVIHDPHRSETFTAIRGRGAYMNDRPIKIGEQSTLGDAIVAMGSPPAELSMSMSLRALPALMPKVRTIRMLGSAALMLAWVACGRLTAYWEYDLSSWDVAAGSILIEEAGGTMSDLKGGRWGVRERKICGSNGLIHEELLGVLREAGVE
jgi:myo-inositol-1(or 4)-monophosphatase